jgi:TM2 domain-containing membrane protein YozV
MNDDFPSHDEFGREIRVRRLPSPGVAAVLAVLIPGLGHVYCGRLLAGAVWFLAITFAYWAIIVPGFLLHAISIWTAYKIADEMGDAP